MTPTPYDPDGRIARNRACYICGQTLGHCTHHRPEDGPTPTTYDGADVTTIARDQHDDEFIAVELNDGRIARCRLWYLRELLENDTHITKQRKD